MKHVFIEGTDPNAPVLLLLHGTGGTEQDLLPLGQMLSQKSSILSVRGNVLENGMPRFFRRLAEGVFDEEDLLFRTQELKDFIDSAAAQYGFNRERVVAVGYSNGANIAGSLLFHHPNALHGAVLYHPMVPRRGVTVPDLSGLRVFIGAGSNDRMCTPAETEELTVLLQDAGAEVELFWDHLGHQLTPNEVKASAAWFAKHYTV